MKTTTLIGLCTIMAILAMCGSASAWISDFDYRMQIDINNTGDTLTDYQYDFTVNTATLVSAGKMQADGGDCRITNATDVLQEFWNETAFNNASTKIWVNASSLGNLTNTTHYLYYGNSGASDVSNITTTMVFGDDFDSGELETNLHIDSTLEIGGFSCWANPRIYPINDTSVWIYNSIYESSTESHMARHVYNITTNTEISETSLWDDSNVICSTRGFESVNDTYHILFFYETSAGADISLRKREGSDGLEFNASTQAILCNSTGEIWADTIKISDAEFWIYYTDRVDASHHDMYRVVVNESGYASPDLLFTTTTRRTWQKPKLFDGVYYLYYDDHGTAIYARASVDGVNFGSETTLISGDLHATQVEKLGDTYFMIYNQGFTSLRVATCDTPNGTFTYSKQLYSGYKIPGDTIVFDTNKILLADAVMPENVAERLYVEQLSLDYTVYGSKWDGNTGDALIAGGVLSFGGDFSGTNMRSISQFGPTTAMRSRMKFLTPTDHIGWMGFMNPAETHFGSLTINYVPENQFGSRSGGSSDYINTNTPLNSWFVVDILIDGGVSSSWFYDGVEGTNSPKTSAPPNTNDLEISIKGRASTPVVQSDWIFVRKYSTTEPVSSLGTEQNVPMYTPPTPTSLANTTGNFWVNHTWSHGSGNVTDSYNVSVNSVWHNTTPAYYNDTGLSAHAWSNATVFAFNTSGNGTLSTGSISQNTQIPNNPITLTNASDWSGAPGSTVYVDYDATDADSDTPTFSCNRTDLFSDFSASTGKGNWTAIIGAHYVDFGASDGYGSTSNYTMTIAVGIAEYTPPTPTSLANTTGNFWVNHTWSPGSGNITDSYNVSVNSVWHNTSPAYYNDTYSAHVWQNITVYAFNTSGNGALSADSITQNTQIPNNPITITNTSNWAGSTGETVYVDYDATDADSDTPTFSCNRTDLFTDFDTATGTGNWSATAGTYYVDFGVSDGYGSTDNYTMTITASIVDYTPPTPTSLANTTGNFWVNHTWSHGSGNVTDSYNVSVNDVWHNTTPAYYNDTYSAHAWQNITIFAFNTSGAGSLSTGSISQNARIPNNPITITNTSGWTGNEGENVYVDYDATDSDFDTPAFSCNRTDMFSDFSTSTGEGNWSTGYADAGTYYIDFGASDGYGSSDNYTMTITVNEHGVPGTPTSLANTTGNFWVNHTWISGGNTDTYNVSVNTVWHNATSVTYNNTTASSHAWVNISLAGYNTTTGNLSSFATQDTQIPNNAITITNTSDWSGAPGSTVYVDYDATDADSDTPTFSCNRTDLFTDFDTANGTGNWQFEPGTYYVDFGVSDGYGSADNYTMTIGATPAPIIALHSVYPETIQTNYTGEIQVNYLVESSYPLDLSTLAMLYGVNCTITGDMHSYVAAPANSIASEGIYRAPYRNTTPYLSWENNATITEGNVWQWSGRDNNSTWVNVTSINATHTWINATGFPEHIFQGSFYLGRRAMDTAPKTAFEVNRQQGIIIKMWDNEVIRGRSVDYLMSMYFDSDWESTIPSHPIEIWGLNSSFNPDTDDPTTSEFGAKMVEWDGNRWINHSWVPDSNASYAYPLVLNASSFPVIPDDINYIYLKSGTLASKSYILNATNHDPGICNITYAQTETMWTYNELSDVSDQVAYTPSFFTTFARDDEQFLHHLYIADDQGVWAHSDINNISIGVSHYPVAPSSFEYFNITCPALGYTLDTGMGSTYDNGYMHIGIYCHADPDGGTVSHNITLHYVNETLVGIVNNTFQTTSPGLHEINFTTTPYYSTTDAYILKCVSTDDEGVAVTTWLDSFFTLAADGTQGYYVNDYLMFWGMNDIPTLCTAVANNSLISYDAGDDIYTMHVPFFKSKCNDTFRFNETVHLKSLNTEDVAFFRFGGETIFDNANIYGWNTVSDAPAPSTDTYRAYMYSCCQTTGNITNSNLSYLGSNVYRQEGLNFIDNSAEYLIYNTTLSHNDRGIIMEECEDFTISHCNIHDNTEVGIGIYYSNNTVVENSTVTDSGYNPCIYLYEASDNIVKYNTIQNCVDYGIQVRSNSNNNIFTGNNVAGSGIYDYYFRASSVNNSIIDPASATDKIRATITSEVNIENTDNAVFTEDSPNSTYAYPTNFSMRATGVSQTFNITQRDITVTPDADSVQIWNLVFGNVVTFNATNSTGSPHVWFNITQPTWENANISIYRDDVIYANETADPLGHIAYNYSGGWSEHWFEFASPNAAPDKPTVVTPANGATGTSTNPTLTVQVTDDNAADLLNVTFYAQGGAQIGSTQTGIANGSTASVVWSGRSYSTTYYWYAVADDGTAQTQSDTWHFTTQSSGSGSSHVIDITGCTDWSGNAGTQVYIDFGCTGETAGATFTTDATNGTIDPSTGIYTWNTATADAGVHTWRFDVENVYSVSDYCDVTVTVYHYASPTNLAATTGNFWVNHTWDGNGFADSYNVSVNDVWTNGSTDQYSYHVRYPHAWSNISVAAFNDATGLSSFISNDVQVPNNVIVLTNYSVLMLATAGDNVTVDMNHEDLDGDTATYYCSRMDLFADFSTADGTGKYTNAVNGTHEVIFGVTDGYGWDNETITIEVGTVHPLELDEETPLILFVVLVVLLFGSLFYIYHAASYVAKIVTALISTWMSFMLSNMAVSGNVVLNYAELSSGDAFIYGTHSIQIAALSHFFMFTGVVSALFMLAFAVKLVIDTYLDMQEKRKADEEWDGVEQ